jgi:hypothetical protein
MDYGKAGGTEMSSKFANDSLNAARKLLSMRLGDGPSTRRAGDDGKRTTFKAPAVDIRSLRELALRCDCSMNDLIEMLIADLLTETGRTHILIVKPGLRDKITKLGSKEVT